MRSAKDGFHQKKADFPDDISIFQQISFPIEAVLDIDGKTASIFHFETKIKPAGWSHTRDLPAGSAVSIPYVLKYLNVC